MVCLNNLIGISPRTGDTSTSGLYLEQRGITLEHADAANEVYLSGLKLIQDVMAFSQYELVQDMINLMANGAKNRKAFIQGTVLQSDTVGYYQDNKPTLAADATKMRGIMLETQRSPYLKINITSISLLLQVSGAVVVEVWDLLQNKKIAEQSVTAVAGEVVTVPVNINHLSNGQKISLAVLYNASNAAYKTYVNQHLSCLGCKKVYHTSYCLTQGVEINTGADKIRSNITGGSGGTSGLTINYSLQCDPSPLLCNMKNTLALPFLYKTEANLYKRMMKTDRVNSKIKLPSQDLETSYNEAMALYQDSLNNIINGMQLPSDVCFKCNSRLTTQTLIP